MKTRWMVCVPIVQCLSLLTFVFLPNHLKAQELELIRDTGGSNLIIFIHGIRGDGESTWANENSGVSWSSLIQEDDTFSKSDIATYHYPSSIWEARGLRIGDAADMLRVFLDSDSYSSYKNIFFISHSMGGLITRNFLLKNRHYASRVPLIYFLATPTSGSNLADIASALGLRSAQLKGLMELENNNFLADQTSLWQSWTSAKSIKSLCAYEKLKTKGVLVVAQASAQALCTEKPVPIFSNHIDIAKPDNHNSLVYIAFKNAYIESTLIINNNRFGPNISFNTGWVFIGYFDPISSTPTKGPFLKLAYSPTGNTTLTPPQKGDILSVERERNVIIARYKIDGIKHQLTAPGLISGILTDDDYTGLKIPVGKLLQVEDCAMTKFEGPEMLPAVWCRITTCDSTIPQCVTAAN